MDKPKQKYSIDQTVGVQGWTKSDTGVIEDIQWIFHNRSMEYMWGYKIKYDNDGAGLSLVYVTEGYLRDIENV